MNPGTLDRRIDIQCQQVGTPLLTASGAPILTASGAPLATSAQDPYGEPVYSWVSRFIAWARRIESKGIEAERNQREGGRQPVTFRIRYRSGVSIEDRVLYDGQAYDITSTSEIGRRHMLDLHCTLNTTPGNPSI